MLLPKTPAHIRTSRTIKRFRACRCSTGISMAHVDNACIVRQQKALVSRQMRRVWLVEQYRTRPRRTDADATSDTVRDSPKPVPMPLAGPERRNQEGT